MSVIGVACGGSTGPTGRTTGIEVRVAPLQLDGIDFACYDLLVQNEDLETVISRGNPATNLLSLVPDMETMCSTQFGTGPGGDISYVAPCDSQRANHTVTVWVDGLYNGSPTLPVAVAHQDPCPMGCALPVVCTENADTPVTFNLTVMRPADQGFFDVAVNFRDIFCSAKVDCSHDGEPIDLLHHPVSKERDQTLVLGFACTTGAGDATDTVLFREPIVIDCGGVITTLDPAIGEGNAWSKTDHDPNPNDAVWQYATYFGEEALSCGNASCNKSFWNVAVGFDPTVANCTVTTRMTAGTAAEMPTCTTPEAAVYPFVDVNVRLTRPGGGLQCSTHPLNGAPGGVTTEYTTTATTATFGYLMAADSPSTCGTRTSCLAWLNAGSTTNGVYLIDPDGPGGAGAFEAYCNMTEQGGGWTLVLTASNDSTSTWTWNNTNVDQRLLTTTTTPVGSVTEPTRDFKSPAYHRLKYTDILFIHQPSGVTAEYNGSGTGNLDMGSFHASLLSQGWPTCDYTASNHGFDLTGGTLPAQGHGGRLCDFRLYFNMGDHELNLDNCLSPFEIWAGPAFGFHWSTNNGAGCPFDDPSDAGIGIRPPWDDNPNPDNRENREDLILGYGAALRRNTGPPGTGANHLQMFVR